MGQRSKTFEMEHENEIIKKRPIRIQCPKSQQSTHIKFENGGY